MHCHHVARSLVSMVSMRAADEDGILDGTFKDHGQTEMTVG